MSPPAAFLTDEQRKYFLENGCLVIENFLESEQCDRLRADCRDIVDNVDLNEHRTVFFGENKTAATTERNYSSQRYFFDSWDKVSFFFEKDAFGADGELSVPRHRCINKIGHYLHALRQPFRQVTFDPRAQAIAKELGMLRPRVCQSMYIFKQPEIGAVVDSHQDATFLWTEPTCRLLGYWVALEDATLDNGCLWFVPGSHRRGLLDDRRFVRAGQLAGGDVRMEFTGRDPNDIVPLDQYVPLQVKKGSLVLIDGFVLHMSKANTSSKSREIYTWHAIDLPDGVAWSQGNWMQPPCVEDGFELLCDH